MPAISLRSGLEPKSPWSRLCAGIKLGSRALAHPQATRAYLRLLNSHPALSALADSQPRLLHKIYRPWLSNRLDLGQRLAGLQAHYGFVVQQGWGELMARAVRGALPLASVEGKSGAAWQLALRAIVPMERDGEMVLELRREGVLVYSLAFAFIQEQGRIAVAVGCIQGANSGDGLALCREATRDLHGLRPKFLLLRLVRSLGYACGCRDMLLVGKANLAVRSSMRKGKVMADYDAVWQELAAVPRADGDYSLACEALRAPDLDAVPSKKRAEARRRHALALAFWDGMHAELAPVWLPAPLAANCAARPLQHFRVAA